MEHIDPLAWILIYFIYGLAFFCMGFAIALEGGRGSDLRLRHALRPLAAFGFLHGLNEWLDMMTYTNVLPTHPDFVLLWEASKLMILAFSFLSLAGFGFSSLAHNTDMRRMSLLAPLLMAAIWGIAMMALRDDFTRIVDLQKAAGVLTRYMLGIPAAVIASIGLVAQQRAFRREGFAQFGRDSLAAAIAFAWYGVVGQLFGPVSRLFPSTIVNEELFYAWFSFPVQFFRAGMAVAASLFVIRFLRSFDAEIEREIGTLQKAKLDQAKRREKLRGQLLQRVVGAQESERKRIARELHDETGQTLTAVGMGISAFKQNYPGGKAQQQLDELEGLVQASLADVQRIIRNLRPSQLDDLGLAAALRWYVGKIQERSDQTKFHFEVQGEIVDLDQNLKTALFRIGQESITNALKYAKAQNVWIRLRYAEQRIELLVRDDGVGFDQVKLEESGQGSWGILGMRERTNLLKGKFNLQSGVNQGVEIRVDIPIEEIESNEEEAILDG